MAWKDYGPKSAFENQISDTSVANPEPKATSSVLEMEDPEKVASTRATLDKLKAKLEKASTSVSKSL